MLIQDKFFNHEDRIDIAENVYNRCIFSSCTFLHSDKAVFRSCIFFDCERGYTGHGCIGWGNTMNIMPTGGRSYEEILALVCEVQADEPVYV